MFSVTLDHQMVLRALYHHSLLALASVKPVSKLSALSVDPTCLMFGEYTNQVKPQLKGVKHLLCDMNHLKINSK